MRNHQALLDTANGTITFPHVEITLAMKDEMKKCNPHAIQIRINGTQTVPAQQTLTVNAVAITNIVHPITGTIQPEPQYDEDAQIIVAPALATSDNKQIKIRVVNTTDTPYTIPTNTKRAELQMLKPDDTKNIRSIDVAALKVLEDPNDTITYVREIMKADSDLSETDRFWFPTPENPGKGAEHTPIQNRILKEIRELEHKETLNPNEDSASRGLFFKMFQWKDSFKQGKEKQQLEDVIIEYNDFFGTSPPRHRHQQWFQSEVNFEKRESSIHSQAS